MKDKTRDYDVVNFAIEKVLEDNTTAYTEYHDDTSITVDGHFSLAELRALVAAIESVPLE